MPEETDVQRGGGADAPVEFRWNGQLHRVRSVLTHHRIRSYPATPSAGSVRPDLPHPSDADAVIEVIDELSARRAARAGRIEADEVEPSEFSFADGPGRLPRGAPWHHEEVWRVHASPAATSPTSVVPGVFDLHFDWAVGRWTVTRIDTLEEEL